MDGLAATITASGEGCAEVALKGHLDFATRGRMTAAVHAALHSYTPKRLVIDLAQVAMIDSAGIGGLVAAWKTARAVGTTLEVVNPNRLTYWQLELTGLLETFGQPQPPSDVYRPGPATSGPATASGPVTSGPATASGPVTSGPATASGPAT